MVDVEAKNKYSQVNFLFFLEKETKLLTKVKVIELYKTQETVVVENSVTTCYSYSQKRSFVT